MSLPESINLSKFREIPTNPAYRVARDGRVFSLKSMRVLSEQRTGYAHSWRVRLAGQDLSIRTLVWTMWGTSIEFEERADDWISAHPESRQEVAA